MTYMEGDASIILPIGKALVQQQHGRELTPCRAKRSCRSNTSVGACRNSTITPRREFPATTFYHEHAQSINVERSIESVVQNEP